MLFHKLKILLLLFVVVVVAVFFFVVVVVVWAVVLYGNLFLDGRQKTSSIKSSIRPICVPTTQPEGCLANGKQCLVTLCSLN